MNTVSPDYKEWVTLQSTEKDPANAYYNMNAFGFGEKSVTNRMNNMDMSGSAVPREEKKVPKIGDYCPCPFYDEREKS